MNSLKNYESIKQQFLSCHRPCYPVPQYMSEQDSRRLNEAKKDLQDAYNKERAKPVSQRNNNLIWEMDQQLYPRFGGW